MKVFVQGPETFLTELGIEPMCAMDPSRPAVLDADHRVSVGYETFLFSSPQARERFIDDLAAHCGILTDPVSKERFRARADSPRLTHNGRVYLFSKESSKSMFLAMPDSYADPNYKMFPKEGESGDG